MKKIILYFFSYALSQEYLHEKNREIDDIMKNLDRQNVNSWMFSEHRESFSNDSSNREKFTQSEKNFILRGIHQKPKSRF